MHMCAQYSKQMLNNKIDDMFIDLRKQSNKIIAIHSDMSLASKMIVDAVSSETVVRSQTLFTDMYKEMSERTLSLSTFDDPERVSRFYEANIRGDILAKCKFDVTNLKAVQHGVQYKEIDRLYLSLAAAAGTTAVGGVLRYVLSNSVNIPIVVIIAGAAAAFFGSYFKGAPTINKKAFSKATEEFLYKSKEEFIMWFDEVERYYYKRLEDLVNTFSQENEHE